MTFGPSRQSIDFLLNSLCQLRPFPVERTKRSPVRGAPTWEDTQSGRLAAVKLIPRIPLQSHLLMELRVYIKEVKTSRGICAKMRCANSPSLSLPHRQGFLWPVSELSLRPRGHWHWEDSFRKVRRLRLRHFQERKTRNCMLDLCKKLLCTKPSVLVSPVEAWLKEDYPPSGCSF